jgi:hypothetical protein
VTVAGRCTSGSRRPGARLGARRVTEISGAPGLPVRGGGEALAPGGWASYEDAANVGSRLGEAAPGTTFTVRLGLENARGRVGWSATRQVVVPAPPPPRPPAVETKPKPLAAAFRGSTRLRVDRRGRLKLAVSGCGRCRATLEASVRDRRKRTVRAGRTAATLPASGRGTVTLRLTAAVRRELTRRRKLTATVRLVVRDAAGQVREVRRGVTLLAPARRR